jgi:hypothetical protein
MNEQLAGDRTARAATRSAAGPRPWIRSQDLHEVAQPLEKLILQHPAVTLGSAFLIGVAVAWWLKRR